jgi:hypothetical protein
MQQEFLALERMTQAGFQLQALDRLDLDFLGDESG